MTEPGRFSVGSYELDGDRFYDPATHLWVSRGGGNRVRCGFDPLGAETCGDIVAVSFEPLGTRVEKGEALGYVEAAKFVGPLLAPVTATLVAHNPEPIEDPALLNSAPMSTWLVELEAADPERELAALLTGQPAVESWFAAEVERFARQGMTAE